MDGRPAGSSSGPAASAAAPERGHGRSVGADETSTAPTGPTVSARGEATSMWVTAGTVEDSTVGGPGGISSRSAVGTPECSADGVSTIRPTGSVGCRPCFAIRARTVLRVIPRIAAVREMFHPVRPSTSLRRWRSQAARSPGGTSVDRRLRGRLEGQVGGRDHRGRAHDHGPLDDAIELAHVARPVIGPHRGLRLRAQRS